MGNMDIWDRNKTTDLAFTKKVSHRGGFTSIDQTYQSMRATKEFGPYGHGWGLKNAVFGYVGDPPTEIWCEAIFWYDTAEEVAAGQFPISVDLAYKVGQDCRKKLLTECKSKALAMLGFSADVYMGKFDDQTYVEELKHDAAFDAAASKPAKRNWLIATLNMCGCEGDVDYDAIVRWAIVDDEGNPKFENCAAMKDRDGASEVAAALNAKFRRGIPYEAMLQMAKDAENKKD